MKEQKGITLVALIITIIVMLILVAVTVTIAIESGLFDVTREVSDETNNQLDLEHQLANRIVNINHNLYDIEDYGTNSNPQPNP